LVAALRAASFCGRKSASSAKNAVHCNYLAANTSYSSVVEGKMRTIILTYPGYQSLPRGIKQMLLASESFYFDESRSAAANCKPKDAKIAQFTATASFGNPLAVYAGT
jgi:hypothetical protein